MAHQFQINRKTRRNNMIIRKVHVVFLSVICYSALGVFMIMNILLASNLHSVDRSDMESKLVANVVMEVGNPQGSSDDADVYRHSNVMMPKCQPPHQHLFSWKYYNALVDTNLETAAKALNWTENSTIAKSQLDSGSNINDHSSTAMGYSKYVPHRLIFTHKENLFNCSIFESNATSPELYTLAENAKATVNAYSKILPDLEVVFLSDQDCLEALNEVEPDLIPFFHNEIGMYKADICRAAYLYLHGGYYFDVDVLVVRPFLAGEAKFVTVKGTGYEDNGFFQAFLAVEKQNPIIGSSIRVMLEMLQKKRHKSPLFGPVALLQAWKEEGRSLYNNGTIYDNDGTYLLVEGNANTLAREYSKISRTMKRKRQLLTQKVPTTYSANPDDICEFSAGLCNFIVIDDADQTLYFYSRILGTELCGKLLQCRSHPLKEHINAPPCEPSSDGKSCYWWPNLDEVTRKVDCEYSSDWPQDAWDSHNLFHDYKECCHADDDPSLERCMF